MVMNAANESRTRTIAAGEFKAKCLQLMDEVNEKKLTLTVTKRGRPVGQFVPMPREDKPFRSIVGRSPGIHIPPDFAELRASLASDWADPTEAVRASKGRKLTR